MKLLISVVLAVFCAGAFAQAAREAPSKAGAKIQKKRGPARPAARIEPNGPQYRALQDATKNENRKFDALSKKSKEKHNQVPNSVRNER